ncbi:MAG: ABC transporter ATP-binding protein [Steroidobacteraceae bacterium]
MIEIDRLSVNLGSTTVLDRFSATIERGSWVAVVGPNGAGKTTLLRAVAGLVDYQGEIRINGQRAPRHAPRVSARLVAFVPQRPRLPPAMTVTDYVLLGRSAHHHLLASETLRDRRVAAAVLDRLELTPFAQRPLEQLSGGEAQRVVLARSLAQEAPLLVLDEPTSSLDLGHGQLVLELADALRREHGLTVLAALHDLTLAAQYADRLIVLSQGRAVMDGPAAEVLNAAMIERIFDASIEVLPGRDGPVVAPLRPTSAGCQQSAARLATPRQSLQ